MRFKVIAGVHYEGDRAYKAGDVVVSEDDLCATFKNKFERVGGRTIPSDSPAAPQVEAPKKAEPLTEADETPSAPTPTPTGPSPEEVAAVSKSAPEPKKPGITTLMPIHRGKGRWDVVKVINGVITDETVNEKFLSKKKAADLAAKGIK